MADDTRVLKHACPLYDTCGNLSVEGAFWRIADALAEMEWKKREAEAQALADILNGDLPDPDQAQGLREAMRANL